MLQVINFSFNQKGLGSERHDLCYSLFRLESWTPHTKNLLFW